MTRPITVETTIHFRRRGRGSRREIASGTSPAVPERPPGRVPRISRLMALAIRFEQLIRTGEITDYAELARLGHVSRARIEDLSFLVHEPEEEYRARSQDYLDSEQLGDFREDAFLFHKRQRGLVPPRRRYDQEADRAAVVRILHGHDHYRSRYALKTEGRGRTVDEWKIRPDRGDNHLLDGLVGCAVAASIQGAVLLGTEGVAPARPKRVSFAELQRRNRR